jgi:hypothetical protein
MSTPSPRDRPARRQWLEPWLQLSRGVRAACVLSWLAGAAVIVCDLALGWEKHLWANRPFLTNIASGLTAALFGLPFGLVVIAYLARLQEERLQDRQQARSARRAAAQMQALAEEFLAVGKRATARESLRALDEPLYQAWNRLGDFLKRGQAERWDERTVRGQAERWDEGTVDDVSDEVRFAAQKTAAAAVLAYNMWHSTFAADAGPDIAKLLAQQWSLLEPTMHERAEDLGNSEQFARLTLQLEDAVAELSRRWQGSGVSEQQIWLQGFHLWATGSLAQEVPISFRLQLDSNELTVTYSKDFKTSHTLDECVTQLYLKFNSEQGRARRVLLVLTTVDELLAIL